MTHKNFRPALLAVTLMTALASAHAGLIIENGPTSEPTRVSAQGLTVDKPVPNQKSEPVIVNIGKVPSNLRRLSLDMSQKSVGEALAAIVPKGWSGYASDPRIKALDNISFMGQSRQWPVVLKEILEAHGMTATINWNKREISVNVGESGVR